VLNQRIKVHPQLPFRIAVVGIDADDLGAPIVPRSRNVHGGSESEVQAPRKLLTDEYGTAPPDAVPCLLGRRKHRKMHPVRLVRPQSDNVHRPARKPCWRFPHREDRRDFWPLLEPGLDTPRCRIAYRLEINLRDESLIEPRRECLAESFDHRTDAYVG